MPAVLIISQISQMNQVRKHIIPICKTYRVILKGCHIHFYGCTRQHLDNCRFQAIKIHVDQWHNCLITSGI